MKFILLFLISFTHVFFYSQVSKCDYKYIEMGDEYQVTNKIYNLLDKYKADKKEETKRELFCILENLDRNENKLASFILASEYYKGSILNADYIKAEIYIKKLFHYKFETNSINIKVNELIYDIYYKNLKPLEGIQICENRLKILDNGECYFYFAEKLRKREKLFKKSIELYEIACKLSEARACNRLTDYRYLPEEFENRLRYAPPPKINSSPKINSTQIDYDQIFTDEMYVDKTPDFEGGISVFRDKLNDFLDTSKFMGNEGMVKTILTFTVDNDGSMIDIRTLNRNIFNDENESLLFNSEIKKSIKQINTKWSPAILNNVKVKYRMRFPIQLNFESF